MMRMRIRKNYRISRIIILIIILIFFFTYTLYSIYNKKITPKIIDVAEMKLQKFTESILSNNIGYDILNDEIIKDILVINKNNNGEILYVDYNLDQAYLVLDIVTKKLDSLINDLENGQVENLDDANIENSKYGLIMKIPMFIASHYALMANMGPTIYLKINFTGSILTNIKSKITNYGMNNALVELYVTIKINEELMAPVVNKTLNIEYDVLIASQVINGRIPEYYGGLITGTSNILSIPIEK